MFKYLNLHLYDKDSIMYSHTIDKNYLRSSYHTQFYKKVYGDEPDKHNKYLYAMASLINLLEYCKDHDEDIIKKVDKPKFDTQERKMFISQSTIIQFNLYSNHFLETRREHSNINSLLSVIDKTRTAQGRRFLLRAFQQPHTDPEKIQTYYDLTGELIKHKGTLLNPMEKILSKVPDLDLLHRRIILSKISLTSMRKLVVGYKQIQLLVKLLQQHTTILKHLPKLLPSDSILKDFASCSQWLMDIFDPSKFRMARFDKGMIISEYPIFTSKIGIMENLKMGKEYAKLREKWYDNNEKLYKIKEELSKHGTVELVFKDKYYMQVTKTVAKKALAFYENATKDNKTLTGLKSETVRGMGARVHIFNEESLKLEAQTGSYRHQMQTLAFKLYNQVLDTIYQKYAHIFRPLRTFISKIDFVQSAAKCAILYNYVQPTIKANKKSFFQVEDLRHPIVERIINDEYIPNDLTLGLNTKGCLLYGCNSAGKTTLTKAAGIAIIMAQVGYYVPAKSFKFCPYEYVITRLSGNDNIFSGDSSFVVEMKELNTILKHASKTTLVLGDELCRGTESISGTSLTIATLLNLIENDATFIFATHMHHLPDSKYLTPSIESQKLKVYHLEVGCDVHNNLLYNRKLKNGVGGTLYGIEVAKSLNLDKAFLDKTYEIRKSLLGEDKILSTKLSRYNSNLYVDHCVLCGSKEQLETHHIREQHLANDIKYIGHVPRDSKANLSILCKKCHLKMSQGWKVVKNGDDFKMELTNTNK
jgi:DNA mismatch repair protein MutS